jgi:hypothetical protein
MKLEKIQDMLIKEFENDFTLKSRVQENVYQRAVYFRLCREFSSKPLKDIGSSIGRDHATVLHALKIFTNLKLWNETRILDIYQKVKDKILKENIYKNRNNLNARVRNRKAKDNYRLLLHNYINLKQKFYNLEQALEKIS